jgi:hypothetical protein
MIAKAQTGCHAHRNKQGRQDITGSACHSIQLARNFHNPACPVMCACASCPAVLLPETPYICDSLSPDEFRFDAQLPTPVLMLREDADRCHLTTIPRVVADIVQMAGEEYHDLSDYFKNFLKNSQRGSADDNLHSRNDQLLQVCIANVWCWPLSLEQYPTCCTSIRGIV